MVSSFRAVYLSMTSLAVLFVFFYSCVCVLFFKKRVLMLLECRDNGWEYLAFELDGQGTHSKLYRRLTNPKWYPKYFELGQCVPGEPQR